MRTGEYVNRLHLVGLATLAVLVTGLAWTGWALRPASAGFSEVPTRLQLVTDNLPGGANVELSLTRTGQDGAARLLLKGPVVVPGGRWDLYVTALGTGSLCTPTTVVYRGPKQTYKRYTVPRQHRQKQPPLPFTGPSPEPQPTVYKIEGSGPFFVQFCWTSRSPMFVNGAYLTARFPPLYASVGVEVAVTTELNLGTGNTLDYAVQSLTAPSSVTYGGWQWTRRPPGTALAFAAVNTSETQHDTFQAFLSGIFFGVAGGALVALIQELVAPFRSRRELRPPEPGG